MDDYSKILKCSKVPLVIVLIMAVISIALVGFGLKMEQKENAELVAKDYNELISLEQDIENEYVEVTITDIPYGFAEETVDGNSRKYYFVYDKYDYMYIVRLTDSTFEMLEELYNKNSSEFSYTLRGYIFDIEDELKELAKSAYNEAMNENLVNEENFRSFFGNTYLDENKTPFNINDSLMIVGIIGIFIAFIIFIIYLIGTIKLKKALRKYEVEDLAYELSKSSTLGYKKANIYLTDKYIISKVIGVDVLEYNELVWIYTEIIKQNGIPVSTNLIAYTNNNKRYQLAMVYADEKMLQEIMSKIKEKNPQVLIGYTKENQQTYKEMKKINK